MARVKPTDEQIQAEIETLRKMKPSVRHYTAFGDDNRAAIAVQIKVLESKLSESRIFDRYEETQHLLDNALYAREWLDGYSDQPPSEDWAPLAKVT